ncbi:Glycosyltransferase involved in cell wall bisynthesis [Tistlia consotensis]|uniref:Glycosyltransferase involved in cell wall bisynthesis n=1 Tax=Tistlia consotensis USBA 355 TaxID=560819 RepID=A0A1Y6BNG6_9PROT|nr:glycosyltransferase [Tistlia consotensis]SMF21116.1 Glycosyltransferase involved in cell wall bisynthesis [Tistlia consotensis USBA 355]SNR47195.1 Glycosyltransferase involved in cell wall bisynthesis [Tistlia consotensis]
MAAVAEGAGGPSALPAGAPPKVLVVGHTYMVRMNQRKLEAVWRGGLAEPALLAPARFGPNEWGRVFEFEPPAFPMPAFAAPVFFGRRVGGYFYSWHRLRRAIRAVRPDLLHVEAEPYSLVALQCALAARLCGLPLSFFTWENVDRRLSPARRLSRRFVLRSARLAVAGNEAAAGLLAGYGYRGASVVLPQLGIEAADFPPRAAEPDGEALRVGFVGRLIPEKGVDLLLRAAARLARDAATARSLRLVICGGGSDEARLRALAAELGIAGRVEWLPAVPHEGVAEVLAGLHLLVLPSRSSPTWQEQFGHVLIEAMAVGVPVVGARSGAIPEVIGRDDCLFAEEDDAALAALLARARDEPAWREELARRGAERVKKLYTHDRVAEALARAWRACLHQGRPVALEPAAARMAGERGSGG